MKYIKNTGRYAIAFVITKNNREVKIELDKRRVYMDTGNIATSGITPVEEDDIKQLKERKRFNQEIEAGNLEILDEADVKTTEESKINKLEEENRQLQEQLKKAEKADVKKVEKEKKILEDENASLKKQLESLTKKNKGKEPSKETDASAEKANDEGF